MQRPIFCIGPEEGDSARIINECNAGITINFDNKEKMKSGILKLYEDFKSGKLLKAENENIRNKYSRQKLTGEIVELLDDMIKAK